MQFTTEAGVTIDEPKIEQPKRLSNRFGDAVRQWQLGRECQRIQELQEHTVKDPQSASHDREKVIAALEKARSLAANDHGSWRRLLFTVNSLAEPNRGIPHLEIALQFIEKNIQQIERGISQYDYHDDKRRDLGTKAYHSLALLLKHGYPEQVTRAAEMFKKFESRFAQEIERVTDFQITGDLVAYLLYLAREKTSDSAFFPDATKYLQETIYRLPSGRSSIVLKGIEATDPVLVRGYAEKIVTQIVGDEKVARDMVRSWQVLSEDKKTWRTDPEIVAYNKARMKELEEWRPGSVKHLYDQSGITWFLRYPIRALKDQVDNFTDVTKPYGVIVSAYHEHNRAFGSSSFTEVLSRYYDELAKLGYNVRIVEARSRVTLTRRFVQLKNLYDENAKCQFLIVNAHGSTKGIRLGDDGDMQVRIEDLSSGTSDFLGAIYQQGMPVVFNSCHSFAIAKALAERLNVLAHGSPVIGRLDNLKVERHIQGLSLVPTYVDAKDEKVSAMTFSGEAKEVVTEPL